MSERIVVAYERVSTEQQDISRQAVQRERAASDYPEAELVVIPDDGVSAYKVPIFDRPGGRKLCDLIGSGTVAAVYVDAQDRLSRGDELEWVTFRALCQANGTRLMIDGRELRDDFGGRLEGLLKALLANQESEEKSHRVRSGKARAARQGRPNGGPRRFGFDQCDGQLIPRPAEIAVVERILREAVAGRSQTEIAAGLNADGLQTARGKRWNQPQISQLLGDPIWVGVLRNKEGDHHLFEPFVPLELWEAAQKTLRGPEGPRLGRRTQCFLLGNGLLRCGRCGSAMIVRRDRKSYGWYEVYLCGGRTSGATDCAQGAVHRATVDSAVLSYFERVGLDIEATRREIAARSERERTEIRTLCEQAGRELARVEAGLEKIETDYMLGDLAAADYARFRVRLEDESRASRDALERLEARERETHDPGVLEDVELLTRLTELRAAIAGDVTANPNDFAATHAALRRLFEGFILLPSQRPEIRMDAVVDVDGEEMLLEDIPRAGGYYLEPVPRSDAVVLEGGDRIVPVPLELRGESPANGVGGSISRPR
jgi:site-specific DNA recombinase